MCLICQKLVHSKMLFSQKHALNLVMIVLWSCWPSAVGNFQSLHRKHLPPKRHRKKQPFKNSKPNNVAESNQVLHINFTNLISTFIWTIFRSIFPFTEQEECSLQQQQTNIIVRSLYQFNKKQSHNLSAWSVQHIVNCIVRKSELELSEFGLNVCVCAECLSHWEKRIERQIERELDWETEH